MNDKPISIPAEPARARLREIAEIIRKDHDEGAKTIDQLCEDAPVEIIALIESLQDNYWAHIVGPHLSEIGQLTNNSASNLSVFKPSKDRLDMGGITPEALINLADNGRWPR